MGSLSFDNIAQADLLGRKKFAGQIVKSLVSSFDKVEESIVVGICGRWGSGKSTLLKFIVESIKEEYKNSANENYIIFEFNPWMFSGQEQL